MSLEEVYLGNPLLKKANVQQEFTKEQILEFMACKNDPVYFAKNHVKIVSLDEGLVPFQPYDFQEKLIQNFHDNRFNICKMPRQTGKSTTSVSYLLHYACLLYTSDAADDTPCVDLGGRRIIKNSIM